MTRIELTCFELHNPFRPFLIENTISTFAALDDVARLQNCLGVTLAANVGDVAWRRNLRHLNRSVQSVCYVHHASIP